MKVFTIIVVDISSVEKHLLLSYRKPLMFIHGPMKRNFFNGGLINTLAAFTLFAFGFAAIGYIDLMLIFVIIALAVLVALVQTVLNRRSIAKNDLDGVAPFKLFRIIPAVVGLSFIGRFVAAELAHRFPEGIYLMLLVP